MTDQEFELFIKEQDFIGNDFFDASFTYWFGNNDHIRSPFPEAVQPELRKKTHRFFMEWVYELTGEEKAEIKNEEIVETFEMILFNQALELVKTEDEKITICYPFMPRLGDVVEDKENGTSVVTERKLDVKEDEKKYMKLKMQQQGTKAEWETEFEVPA